MAVMKSRGARSGMAWALVVALAGCGVEPAPSDLAEGPIINGQLVPNDTRGVVMVESWCGRCSGTLLTNDWVLTARHCLNCAGGPGTITVTHGPTSASRTSTTSFQHGTLDVGLIRVASAFAFSGGTQPPATINNRLHAGAPGGLAGQTLRIDGYGRVTCWDGTGTLRTANLGVSSTTSTSITFARNGLAQIGEHGDSGGPSWANVGGTLYVAGVHSYIDQDCGAATLPNTLTDVAASAAWRWVNWSVITPNACAAGRGECDGDYATLCETNLTTSNAHCGACGRGCGTGATCQNGSCVAVWSRAGCRTGTKCCEPGLGGCALCVGLRNVCP